MDKFNFETTAIGSFWHKNPDEAVSSILESVDIPCWPQLPQRSFKENMYVQFSESIPALVINEEERKIFIDSGRVQDEDVAVIYEKYLAGSSEYFSLGRDYASGFYEFISQLEKRGNSFPYLKGQVTGPASFLLTVTDENKKPLIYNSQLADCLVKVLTMKARWQAKKLKKNHSGVIIFIDEPYLVSIGSGYVNLNPQELAHYIDEVIEGIHKEGALAGIHCCGNTDWGFLTRTKTDIVNFDAYGFVDSLLLYPEEIRAFLERGGAIAWGIVPTGSDIKNISPEDLIEKLNSTFNSLKAKGIDRKLISGHSLISPSCGLGSLDAEKGKTILKYARKVSDYFRE